MTTVLIVDDHETFRSFARMLLEGEGFDVIGEAGDGTSALSAAETLNPELVLLDVQLPDLSGFEVSRRLTDAGVPSVVILVSSREASDYDGAIGESGARGFISKAELSGEALRGLLEAG